MPIKLAANPQGLTRYTNRRSQLPYAEGVTFQSPGSPRPAAHPGNARARHAGLYSHKNQNTNGVSHGPRTAVPCVEPRWGSLANRVRRAFPGCAADGDPGLWSAMPTALKLPPPNTVENHTSELFHRGFIYITYN